MLNLYIYIYGMETANEKRGLGFWVTLCLRLSANLLCAVGASIRWTVPLTHALA